MVDHLFPVFGILNDLVNMGNNFTGKITIHRDYLKPPGFNVRDENRVTIDQNRLSEIESFQ